MTVSRIDCQNEKFAFVGDHLMASYVGCNKAALRDHDGLADIMKEAVKASGATLLQTIGHVFPLGGFTMVMVLSESHASIHTYPEHESCFVDIFTCGNACNVKAFDLVLRDYLRPKEIHRRIFVRH